MKIENVFNHSRLYVEKISELREIINRTTKLLRIEKTADDKIIFFVLLNTTIATKKKTIQKKIITDRSFGTFKSENILFFPTPQNLLIIFCASGFLF